MVAAPLADAAARGPADVTAVYPGEEGSLTHIAATKFFQDAPGTVLRGVGSFANAFGEVSKGSALYAVIPIENSASGSVHQAYDLLVDHDVVIGGELGVHEVYCLCVKPGGGGLASIRRVLSHPNILEACSSFLETRVAPAAAAARPGGPELTAITSTTEAARCVAEAREGEPAGAAAAIATRQAAKLHGLEVIAEDIGNDAFLETRYILIRACSGAAADRPCPYPRDTVPGRKHSAAFVLSNEPAAMFRLLSCWALRGIDVLKVECRPLAAHRLPPLGLPAGTAHLWDYLFYVDYAVPVGQTPEAAARLWGSLAEFSCWQRDFGVYPSQVTRVPKQPQGWADMVDIMTKA